MPHPFLFRRRIEPRLMEALDDSPVVLIHGPRQCGKTTLARYACTRDHPWASGDAHPHVNDGGRAGSGGSDGRRDYAYISLDDAVARETARADPAGMVAELPERVILDEVQRVPELFEAIKLEVDRRRAAGRFLLTGSTNVLLIPRLSDSLAGRMQIVRLHPLAQRELTAEAPPANVAQQPEFLDVLFGAAFRVRRTARLGGELLERIVAGGFPPALANPTDRRRANWQRDYMTTLLERDVREMARITALDALPRLLQAAATQTARLFNLADLAAPFRVSRGTIGGYVALLERLFLLERVPAWHSNRLRRLVKSPRLHFGDTGLAAALLGADAPALRDDGTLLGQLLETFVYQELRRQASWHASATNFFHFRDRDGAEVDIVIERGHRAVAGVEVKAGATVRASDFRGLKKLAAAAGDRFACGVVLHNGEMCARFGDRLYAAPIRTLWETP